MKLVSWNVNGLRACMGKGFEQFMLDSDADVFCIQETKMQKEQADFTFNGFKDYWNSAVRKGYSGTAVFTRLEPMSVTYDICDEEYCGEGRVITLEFDKFYLVTVYTPNSKKELARLDYRMEWEDAFRKYVMELDKVKPVIMCGDFNVAREEIDLKNPKPNMGSAGFTKEEREKMRKLLESGFVDSYRLLYPDKKGAYTWWSYMFHARDRNAGWRIDYFLTSKRITNLIEDSVVYSDVLGSDHCPIGLEINL